MADIAELIRQKKSFNFGGVRAHQSSRAKGVYGVWQGTTPTGRRGYPALQAVHVKVLGRWFAAQYHQLPLTGRVTLVPTGWLMDIYSDGAVAAARLRMGVEG